VEVSAANAAVREIEQLVPPQRVALSVTNSSGFPQRDLTLGVAWGLRAAGYEPAVSRRMARLLGPEYMFRGRLMPHVHVVLRHRNTAVSVTVTPGTPPA
jgi:hypothetical protein